MKLFENEYLTIDEKDNSVFLTVVKEGLTIGDFKDICMTLPRVKWTKFDDVKKALDCISELPIVFGILKPMIEIIISSDKMSVYLHINLKDEDKSKEEISECSRHLLSENNISYGIDEDVLKELPLRTKVLVASGKAPIPGDDAVLTYFKLSESKPVANEDGSVDHYDIQTIDNISIGTWLGRKEAPTSGIDGYTVEGKVLSAKIGRDYPLKFDPKTVNHIKYDDKSEELFAKIDGAVRITSGRIAIDNHLVINGDVDYNTGHIDFDGYVTITGTVKDKFNVKATYDIFINGPMGIGAVGTIESKEGNVSVKGGINGKGAGQVIAKYDVYTKYSNEAIIEAGETIYVDLYALDSDLKAKRIVLPPKKGKIIGGKTFASHKIETGFIGNKLEKPTRVCVKGFERTDIIEMIAYYEKKSLEDKVALNKMKNELEIFEKHMEELDDRGVNTYHYLLVKYDNQLFENRRLQLELDKLNGLLTTKGEGEISIYNNVFPKTMMEFKNFQKRITDVMTGSFYVDGHTIYHNN